MSKKTNPSTLAAIITLLIFGGIAAFFLLPYLSSGGSSKGTEGKNLYLSFDPFCFGDGSMTYIDYYFLPDNKFLGSANFSGQPECTAEEIYIGKWKSTDKEIQIEYKAIKSNGRKGSSKKMTIQLEELKDLKKYAEKLIRKHWNELATDVYDTPMEELKKKYDNRDVESCINKHGKNKFNEISFSNIKSWAFENHKLNYNFERSYAFASQRKLSKAELKDYSKKELRLIRNEIFATYAYNFKSADLIKRFGESFCPINTNTVIDELLSPIELYNIDLIKEVEKGGASNSQTRGSQGNKRGKKEAFAFYENWYKQATKTGKYWTISKFNDYQSSWSGRDKYADGSDYHENCIDGLSKEPLVSVYGDLNDDGHIDFVVDLETSFCAEGTWAFGISTQLMIISNSSSYQVIDINETLTGVSNLSFCDIKSISSNGNLICHCHERDSEHIYLMKATYETTFYIEGNKITKAQKELTTVDD